MKLYEDKWDDFESDLKKHDWNYAYSDDGKVYQKGYTIFQSLVREYLSLEKEDEDKARQIWNKYATPEFKKESSVEKTLYKIQNWDDKREKAEKIFDLVRKTDKADFKTEKVLELFTTLNNSHVWYELSSGSSNRDITDNPLGVAFNNLLKDKGFTGNPERNEIVRDFLSEVQKIREGYAARMKAERLKREAEEKKKRAADLRKKAADRRKSITELVAVELNENYNVGKEIINQIRTMDKMALAAWGAISPDQKQPFKNKQEFYNVLLGMTSGGLNPFIETDNSYIDRVLMKTDGGIILQVRGPVIKSGYVIVSLNKSDLYDVMIGKIVAGGKWKNIKTVDDVYSENLVEVIDGLVG